MSADDSGSGLRRSAKAFDIRTVIALLFVIYGAVLVVMGFVLPPDEAHRDGANLNLWSGLGMLVFSALMGGWVLLSPLKVSEGSGEEPDGQS
ncbi:hypothetical protein [Streptomonospora wellingtoniae]|uniref:DUF485 domain-containing protein n=1 Tax=Streptomonospora wellingtoniae TaxID=3075544 RepID=A0ABU2KWN1_9ACTN|nr:hypothetical protein [Streptomonospora sp. DSM 45055]MDT0303706.1 hypothetical protein [Streptomonospora sp. DSM 45055]